MCAEVPDGFALTLVGREPGARGPSVTGLRCRNPRRARRAPPVSRSLNREPLHAPCGLNTYGVAAPGPAGARQPVTGAVADPSAEGDGALHRFDLNGAAGGGKRSTTTWCISAAMSSSGRRRAGGQEDVQQVPTAHDAPEHAVFVDDRRALDVVARHKSGRVGRGRGGPNRCGGAGHEVPRTHGACLGVVGQPTLRIHQRWRAPSSSAPARSVTHSSERRPPDMRRGAARCARPCPAAGRTGPRAVARQQPAGQRQRRGRPEPCAQILRPWWPE